MSDLTQLGDAFPALKDNPTYMALGRAPRGDPNGPMPSAEEIARYLAATTQNYPKFGGAGGIPINTDAFAAAVEGWPMSRNIEDRR